MRIRSKETTGNIDFFWISIRLKTGKFRPFRNCFAVENPMAPSLTRGKSKASFADVCTLETLFRHKLTAMAIFSLGLIATVAYLFSRDRVYESTSRVFIRTGREFVADATTTVTGQTVPISDAQKREMQSVQDMLKSNAMYESILEKIGQDQILNYSDEFTEANTPSPIMEAIKTQISKLKSFLATIKLADAENKRAKALELLSKQIKVAVEENSNVASMRVRSESPKLSQQVGEAILERFRELHRDAHRAPGEFDFFTEQLDVVKKELDESMCMMRDTKNAAGFSSIADQKLVLTDRIKSIDAGLLNSLSDMKGGEAKIDVMETSLGVLPERVVASEVDGLTNTSKDDMRGRLYGMQVEHAELLARYTPSHSLVKLKKQQMEDAEELFGKEAVITQKTTTLNSTRQEVKAQHLVSKAERAGVAARFSELQKQRELVLEEIREVNCKELELTALQRDIDVLDTKYRKYSESLEQARMDEALQRDNMSSINVVQAPNFNDDPVDLSNTILAIAGLAGSFFGAIGGAFACRYLRNDLTTPEDIERELGIPVLGAIPKSRQRKVQFD